MTVKPYWFHREGGLNEISGQAGLRRHDTEVTPAFKKGNVEQ